MLQPADELTQARLGLLFAVGLVEDLPVGVASALLDVTFERQLAQDLGAQALLEKPFRLSELLQAVGELVGKNPISAAHSKPGRGGA